jgi:hypothetical protein
MHAIALKNPLFSCWAFIPPFERRDDPFFSGRPDLTQFTFTHARSLITNFTASSKKVSLTLGKSLIMLSSRDSSISSMYASGLIPEFVGQVQTMTFYILPNECI